MIAAIGKAMFVKGDWLKPGCVVIDVGINDIPDATKKRGYRMVGDVDFAEAKKVASMITPVPGGVGPMTIAMLLKNTVNLARFSIGLDRLPLRRVRETPALPSRAAQQLHMHTPRTHAARESGQLRQPLAASCFLSQLGPLLLWATEHSPSGSAA